MYTNHFIEEDEHLNWLANVEKDTSQRIFIVFLEKIVRGVVSLSQIDQLHKKASWAFYLDDEVRGGVGAILEYELLNFAFDKIKIKKLNCEVVETNTKVISLHKKFGFVEEGSLRSNIEKNGVRIGVKLLGITKCEWISIREEKYKNYKKLFNNFNVFLDF